MGVTLSESASKPLLAAHECGVAAERVVGGVDVAVEAAEAIAVGGRGGVEQGLRGLGHGVGVAQAQADQPALGRVRDAVTDQLRDDREAARHRGRRA